MLAALRRTRGTLVPLVSGGTLTTCIARQMKPLRSLRVAGVRSETGRRRRRRRPAPRSAALCRSSKVGGAAHSTPFPAAANARLRARARWTASSLPRRALRPTASGKAQPARQSARYAPRPAASRLRSRCSQRLLVRVRRRCRASIELLALPRSTPRRRTSLLQRSSPARSRSSPRLLCRRARASAQGAPIRGCGVKPSGGPSSWPASGSARPPRLSPSSLPPPHPRRKARPARRPLDARSTPGASVPRSSSATRPARCA